MAGFSDESKPLTRFVSALEEHGYVILNAIGPLGVALFLVFIEGWWASNSIGSPSSLIDYLSAIWLIVWNPILGTIIFSGVTIVGAIGQARDSRALKADSKRKDNLIEKLSGDNDLLSGEKLDLENSVRVEVENNYQLAEELISAFRRTAHLWTCQIFNELSLNVKHRISIYYLDSDKNNLVLLDRFAKNHEFNQPGRPFFRRNQGVIGKAWAEGEFFEKKIPIFNRKNTNYYQYLENNYGFTRDISSRLRMKSCTIGGFAIEDAHGHHIGVVIFESQDQNDFDEDQLREIVKRENHRLVEFISDASSRDVRPLPTAKEKIGEEDHEQKVA